LHSCQRIHNTSRRVFGVLLIYAWLASLFPYLNDTARKGKQQDLVAIIARTEAK